MNNSEIQQSSPFRLTPRLIIGFGILVLGLLWTLDNLNILESEPITRWWPVVLIIIGASQLMDRRTIRGGPLVLIIIGTVLTLRRAHLIYVDIGDLVPLFIALLGAKLVWEALTRGRAAGASPDDDSVIHAFAMMSGVRRQSTARDFRGGDANAIMGGVDLDLRNAQIAPNQRVIIDAFAFWGGVEIKVPPHWRVDGQVLPLMGSFEDKTVPAGDGPTVLIRGTAIMGAVEVKN
jgi:hypothetical protein